MKSQIRIWPIYALAATCVIALLIVFLFAMILLGYPVPGNPVAPPIF
jgi:hypothetical protein